MRESVLRLCKGGELLASGKASAKVLRWTHAKYVSGTTKRPTMVEAREMGVGVYVWSDHKEPSRLQE